MTNYWKAIAAVMAAVTLTCSLSAQSVQDIEMLKSLAQSYGYSETEIQQLLAEQMGGGNVSRKTVSESPSVDRNTVETPEPAVETAPPVADTIEAEKAEVIPEVFGRSFFHAPELNFIPNYNIPTPSGYKLAPGDQVIIDLWGASSLHIEGTVSPEGSITIDDVGPVMITGCTVEEAQAVLKSRLESVYSGLAGNEPNTYIRLSLGQIRSLSINMVGDVTVPGTYTLPSLSTAFTALYMAGGPSQLGSLRDIRLYRQGRLVRTIDFYRLIVDGVYEDNIRLEDNDLILVSPYVALVEIKGCVRRPMLYEMKDGETMADLLRFCAGYTGNASRKMVHVERVKGDRSRSFDVPASDFSSFVLEDGDVVTVPENISRTLNTICLEGAVWHPGYYAVSDTLSTLRQLLEKAGGVKDEAYMDRGLIMRLDKDRDTLSLSFNLADVLSGIEDVPLMSEDRIRIFAGNEFTTWYPVYTQGQFNNPCTLDYRDGMTLGDAIILSGGLGLGASKNNIDVARRNFSDGSTRTDTVAVVYTFDIEEDRSALDFELSPYDIVSARTAPNYRPQQVINVSGEVNYPGHYVVEKSSARLSEIIERAGGCSGDAYLEGAVLYRMMTEQEYQRALVARVLAAEEAGVDTSAIEMPRRNQRYNISIDLRKAIENPGSFHDIVLAGNDSIAVPKMNSTVRISGAVLFPNVVTYDPSLSVRQYIKLAGGYARGAIRSQKYIVFMNGSAAGSGSRNFKPMPGCEIIVPQRTLTRRGISATEVMSIASSTTSIAAMVVTMVNQLR
ncbi:MAG TPA: SLBB domain-containing protein [Candidatus Coprenecus pullistercoris]|nr:SLBB domain-containing protein [Candidatus Coprenecus pullistercoris]